MVHECLPQDAPLAGGKTYDTWATKIYQELSGAPDSAHFAAFYRWSCLVATPKSCHIFCAAGGVSTVTAGVAKSCHICLCSWWRRHSHSLLVSGTGNGTSARNSSPWAAVQCMYTHDLSK